jgi:hypothetical protein
VVVPARLAAFTLGVVMVVIVLMTVPVIVLMIVRLLPAEEGGDLHGRRLTFSAFSAVQAVARI